MKSSRKVDSHKVWLGIGISVAVLLLAVLLLYPFLSKPEVGEEKALAGKAAAYFSDTCSNIIGTVSNDGQKICGGGNKWTELPHTGCGLCSLEDDSGVLSSSGTCLISDVLEPNVSYGKVSDWLVKEPYYFSPYRIGCSPTATAVEKGCITANGNHHAEASPVNNKLCVNNDWYLCNELIKGDIFNVTNDSLKEVEVGVYLCSSSFVWNACNDKNNQKIVDKEYLCNNPDWKACSNGGQYYLGKVEENKFLCTATGWSECTNEPPNVIVNGSSYACLDNHWVKLESTTETICANGNDDDSDGKIDAKDEDCKGVACTKTDSVAGKIIWSYMLPEENTLSLKFSIPKRTGCCAETECIDANGNCRAYNYLTGDQKKICSESNNWYACSSSSADQIVSFGKFKCDGTVWKTTEATPPTTDCTNSANLNKAECKGKTCGGSGLFSKSVTWSYNLPGELSLLKANTVPGSKGCCNIMGCASGSTCYDVGTVLSNSYLCGAYNDAGTDIYGSWYVCDAKTLNAVSGDYTCTKEGTAYKWVKTAAAIDCTNSANLNKAECKGKTCEGSGLFSKFVTWSYNLPDELSLLKANTVPGSKGCCNIMGCASGSTCYDVGTVLSNSYLCGAYNDAGTDIYGSWYVCDAKTLNAVSGDYTCDGTKWMKKAGTTDTCTDPDKTYTPNLQASTIFNTASTETKSTVTGKDPYTNQAGSKEDYCEDDKNLQEVYCETSAKYGWEGYECPTGKTCTDGACVTSSVTLGDVTGDGQVNVLDLEPIINHIVGEATLTADKQSNANICTNDGGITVADILSIINYIVGETTEVKC